MPSLTDPLINCGPKMSAFADVLQRAIVAEIEKILAEERAGFQARIERLVREQTANIAARVLDRFEMSMRGPKLVIEVDFQNTRQ